jgi:hypothetical protein
LADRKESQINKRGSRRAAAARAKNTKKTSSKSKETDRAPVAAGLANGLSAG